MSIAAGVGSTAFSFLEQTGSLAILAGRTLRRVGRGLAGKEPIRVRSAAAQTREAGNRSLPLVGLISLLVGMILALQSAYQLRQLGVIDLVADLVAISVTRELAPLLTAIIVAARVGSAITAELATMKVSEEVDALTVMGIDSVSYLVVPRILALAVAMPCLTILADLFGILGGLLIAVTSLDLAPLGYLQDSVDALALEDVWGGLLKAWVFGCLMGLVGCHSGLTASGGAGEVGRATTRAVVVSILLVIVSDLFLTAVLYL